MAKKPFQYYVDIFKNSGYPTEEAKMAAAKRAYQTDLDSTYTGKRPAMVYDGSKPITSPESNLHPNPDFKQDSTSTTPSRPSGIQPSSSATSTSSGASRPSFDTGTTGTSTTDDGAFKIDVGFGLVDENGNPLALAPIQMGSYITALAGKNPKAYARVKAVVAALTGRKTLDPNYVGGYVSKLAQNIMGSTDILAKTGSIEDYFKNALTTATGATSTTPKPYTQITALDPTKARGLVETAFADELHRQPTAEELALYTDELLSAEKKNPIKYTYTKDKAGNTVATQTTGLDEKQFLSEKLRKTEEYAKVKQSGLDVAMQKVRNSAMANGYPLNEQEAASYAEQIRNGASPDEIAATFRKVAAISQPKNIADLLNSGINLSTIYQPYKNVMASTLEVNPDQIKLDDPALSRAIQGDKALTTYEFQRELRRDPRWEYTNNARSEAATVATKVLKDFGFMG